MYTEHIFPVLGSWHKTFIVQLLVQKQRKKKVHDPKTVHMNNNYFSIAIF